VCKQHANGTIQTESLIYQKTRSKKQPTSKQYTRQKKKRAQNQEKSKEKKRPSCCCPGSEAAIYQRPANLTRIVAEKQAYPSLKTPKNTYTGNLTHKALFWIPAPFIKQTSRPLDASQCPSPQQNLDCFHHLLHITNNVVKDTVISCPSNTPNCRMPY
jgi:hypothetical protein